MAMLIGTIVLWVAAISRVAASIRRPDPARISLSIGVLCIAAAFTLSPDIAGRAFDELLDWLNGAELVQHLLFAVATWATLRFLLHLRTGTITRQSTVIQAAVCLVVCFTMIALFSAVPLTNVPLSEQPSSKFTVQYADSLPAVMYRTVFYGYLLYCLIWITVISGRNLRKAVQDRRTGIGHQSTATAASLWAITAGSATAAVAAAGGLTAMVLRYMTGTDARLLGTLYGFATAVAAVLIGLGLLAPVPVEAFLRWHRARRTCAHLYPLWTGLTTAVPDVVLPVPTTRSPVSRAELASTRRRIEIADALHRIRIDRREATSIRRSTQPSQALGRILRDSSAWAVTGSGGVIAADLLHDAEPSGSDVEQIWAVASAYGEAP